MPCPRLLSDIQKKYPPYLIAVTISLEDYHRHYKRQSDAQIKRMAALREGDMSLGSTYILDLQNGFSYRFRDHFKPQGQGIFRGFVPEKDLSKIAPDPPLELLEKNARDFIINEINSKGELHESTPIRFLTVIPSALATNALKRGDLDLIRAYERQVYGHKRIPDPGKKAPL